MNTSQRPIKEEQDIRSFYEAFSASDFDTMSAMMHPDCVLEFPGSSFGSRVEGRSNIITLLQAVQAGFNGSLRFHHRHAIHNPTTSSGAQIAEHWYTTGRTVTGGAYLNRGVAWFRLQDGLIRDFLDFFDTEIVGAFFPDGQPITEFTRANALVDRLLPLAPGDARERLLDLRANA
jgi:ketosteroid isomerase-like protein